jgi:hypothetical protein
MNKFALVKNVFCFSYNAGNNQANQQQAGKSKGRGTGAVPYHPYSR